MKRIAFLGVAIAGVIALLDPVTGFARDGRGFGGGRGGGGVHFAAPPARVAAPRVSIAPRFTAPVSTFRAPVVASRPMVTRSFVAPRTTVVTPRAPVVTNRAFATTAVRRPVTTAGVVSNPALVRNRAVAANRAVATNRAIAVNRAAAANRAAARTVRTGQLPAVAEKNPTAAQRTRRGAAAGRTRGGARAPVVASRDPHWHHWDHHRDHHWNHHRYRWYNNAWVLVDPGIYAYGYYPFGYDYGNYYYDNGYDYGPETVSVATVPDTDALVDNVQQQLANAGYYNGPIDGILGSGTRAAIRQYQADNGLAVTGTITQSLLQSLGLA